MTAEALNTRTTVGAGLGALLGFVFGGGLMGAGIGGVMGAAVARTSLRSKPKGEMTPKLRLAYARAMESMKSPAELRQLGASFAAEGFDAEARMLYERAALREEPPEVQEKRRAAFRKAMASDNDEVITQVANAFASKGALGAARTLFEHAAAVRAAHSAGKNAKPQDAHAISVWADRLAKALMHFGPKSPHARSAARNMIRAQGREPTEASVQELVALAADAIKPPQPEAPAPPPAATSESPKEGTVLGPPAPPIEPVVVEDGGDEEETAPAAPVAGPSTPTRPDLPVVPTVPPSPPDGGEDTEEEEAPTPETAARMRVGA